MQVIKGTREYFKNIPLFYKNPIIKKSAKSAIHPLTMAKEKNLKMENYLLRI